MTFFCIKLLRLKYSVIQLDRHSFSSDDVLDSVDMAFRDENSILYQANEK